MVSLHARKQLLSFLKDDLGKGDVTSSLTPEAECSAHIKANEECTLAGIEEALFLCHHFRIKAKAFKKDGQKVAKGMKIIAMHGSNRKILSIERVLLNVLGRMSGVATLCAKAKKIVGSAKNHHGTAKTTIAATRKTSPGFQPFDKKAAETAGCSGHRKDLHEMVLLKDNHLKFFPSVLEACIAAKRNGKNYEIEVEDETDAALASLAGPHIIMLDNFPPRRAKKCIEMLCDFGFKGKIELSGGITLKNLKKYSNLGADMISMGELTKAARIIDFSLDIAAKKRRP